MTDNSRLAQVVGQIHSDLWVPQTDGLIVSPFKIDDPHSVHRYRNQPNVVEIARHDGMYLLECGGKASNVSPDGLPSAIHWALSRAPNGYATIYTSDRSIYRSYPLSQANIPPHPAGQERGCWTDQPQPADSLTMPHSPLEKVEIKGDQASSVSSTRECFVAPGQPGQSPFQMANQMVYPSAPQTPGSPQQQIYKKPTPSWVWIVLAIAVLVLVLGATGLIRVRR